MSYLVFFLLLFQTAKHVNIFPAHHRDRLVFVYFSIALWAIKLFLCIHPKYGLAFFGHKKCGVERVNRQTDGQTDKKAKTEELETRPDIRYLQIKAVRQAEQSMHGITRSIVSSMAAARDGRFASKVSQI